MPQAHDPKELDILILLPWEGERQLQYERQIQAAQPGLVIRTVGKFSEALELIPRAEIFMSFGAWVQEDIFVDAKRLRWVHAFGTGLDGIIDRPGLRQDVVVTATRGIHGAPLSEMAIMLMLALARQLPRSVRAQGRRDWERFGAQLLCGKTAGIFGVGQIAEALAPRLKALGMHVLGFTRTARNLAGFDAMRTRDAFPVEGCACDFVILLAPLEDDTRRLVDAAFLRAMKPTAYLVNIARGALIDEMALIAALKEGRIAGAALDATEKEPLPSDDPLWDTPNLILTPHLGGFYDGYVSDSIAQLLHNLKQFQAGRFETMLNRATRT